MDVPVTIISSFLAGVIDGYLKLIFSFMDSDQKNINMMYDFCEPFASERMKL